MVTLPPPNLIQGIYLVQTGRKTEALAYLRHAARNEPMDAEGWLWLAAATDDLEEYRYCVQMALQNDPYHPVAQRMRDELARRGSPIGPAPSEPGGAAGRVSPTGPASAVGPYPAGAAPRGTRRRRVLLAVMVLLIVAALVAGAYVLTATDLVQDAVDAVLTGGETTAINVGTAPGFSFEVRLPESWLPADEDSDEWQARRAELERAFPPPEGQLSVWEQVDEPFSAVTRDPVYGGVLPNVRLVETDQAALERDGMVAALTLQEIRALPDVNDGDEATVCNRMRVLAQQAESDGSAASIQDNEVIDSGLVERDAPENCAFFIHRRYTNQVPQQIAFPLSPEQAPDAMRAVTIAVPVGAERYAVWWLTFADDAADAYSTALDRMIDTLAHVPTD